jgi:hypothetical protein
VKFDPENDPGHAFLAERLAEQGHKVTLVEKDPGKTFAHVMARPSAALDRSRHVLLVFTPRGQDG